MWHIQGPTDRLSHYRRADCAVILTVNRQSQSLRDLSERPGSVVLAITRGSGGPEALLHSAKCRADQLALPVCFALADNATCCLELLELGDLAQSSDRGNKALFLADSCRTKAAP
jgi:hypothetical protein